jgi:hypothetical protein
LNPDVANAIPKLVESGSLPPEKAPLLLRVARRELVSVHWELRMLLYAGVLLLTGGVGVLVAENLDRIGPVAIAAGIGLVAAAALFWVWRVAPPFSWKEVRSPNLSFDYILLLGVLLAAADLAYIEVQFTPLGANWTWHLLIVALLTGLAAFRFDSRVVFSVALSTFAAWRGVSVAWFGGTMLWDRVESTVRWNAIGCGILFVVLGFLLEKKDRKAHFEPLATHLGWLLILGGLFSGLTNDNVWVPYTLTLLLCGWALAWGAYHFRRFPLFALGVIGGYAALSRIMLELGDIFEIFGCFWFFGSAILLLFALIAVQRRMREPL